MTIFLSFHLYVYLENIHINSGITHAEDTVSDPKKNLDYWVRDALLLNSTKKIFHYSFRHRIQLLQSFLWYVKDSVLALPL